MFFSKTVYTRILGFMTGLDAFIKREVLEVFIVSIVSIFFSKLHLPQLPVLFLPLCFRILHFYASVATLLCF